eukprot:365554-Chlamydomonas_euryale.AAC.28
MSTSARPSSRPCAPTNPAQRRPSAQPARVQPPHRPCTSPQLAGGLGLVQAGCCCMAPPEPRAQHAAIAPP